MNILFNTIQRNELRYDELADYMSDLSYYGLYQRFGNKVVDFPKKVYLYQDFTESKRLWGKGFSYSNLIKEDVIDRNNLQEKIEQKYFDCIVFSLHHSVHFDSNIIKDYINNINYPKDKVIIIDGQDRQETHDILLPFAKHMFKRELTKEASQFHKPISFAIPDDKVYNQIAHKKKPFAFIHPGSCETHWPTNSRATHVYDNEQDYYQDYRESLYAFTCKKGGWDCMRHYEIMANRCVPIFTDIENCPSTILTTLPKTKLSSLKNSPWLNLAKTSASTIYGGHEIIQGQSSIIEKLWNDTEYQEMSYEIYEYTKINLTTTALADYLISHM